MFLILFKEARKKRVILKSRQKFPFDFFNEHSENLGEGVKQNVDVHGDLAASGIQKTSSEGLLGTGTPRFSYGMSIFSSFKIVDNNTRADSGRLPTNSSKMMTEENDSLSISKNLMPLKAGRMVRSQSLVHCPGQKGDMAVNKNEGMEQENFESRHNCFQPEIERQNISSATIQQRLGHQKFLSKRRVSSLSFLQNSISVNKMKAENLYSYRETENKENTISDTSRRMVLKEMKNQKEQGIDTVQIEPDYFPKVKSSDKMSLYLPAIKNEGYKIEIGGLNPIKICNSLPASHRENYNVQTERQIDSAVSLTANKISNIPLRVQSQGGTPGDLKRRSSSHMSSILQQQTVQKDGNSAVYNTNSMAKIHSSIMKSIESHFQLNRPGKENFLSRSRGNINSERLPSKGKIEENAHKQLQTIFAPKEEHKDICEFSFSKNFYKDKSSKKSHAAIAKFERDKADKNHMKISKLLSNSSQEYLKNGAILSTDSKIRSRLSLGQTKSIMQS